MTVATAPRAALRVSVTGLVQGVGFRPFIHRLATRHGLAGWVTNTAGAVEIQLEGDRTQLDAFLGAVRTEAPPLARIDEITTRDGMAIGATVFEIMATVEGTEGRLPVSPDVALCPACEAELSDPANRRYRYPFITCTDCGPRFTVVESMPFDRVRTSMRAFEQCAACSAEYESPGNRRFHSETNSCAACGPRLWIEDGGNAERGARGESVDVAIRRAVEVLTEGAIVAIRGLGGFHLAVDAGNEAAVARLRRRKHREARPFAVMVRTLEQARRLGTVGPVEEALLSGPERPIVLLRRKTDAPLAPSVAPALDTIGVMLAYTPLHHLLLETVGRPLVMTSGNRSSEPIATDTAHARRALGGMADAFLLHDREITARYDDSVVRVAEAAPVFLRRARGYAPLPLTLPVPAPRPLVAVGPLLKSTFTLASGAGAWVSQHIGDLDDADTLEHFLETLRVYRRLFHINPQAAARDLHPDYPSSAIAEGLGLNEIIAVQHHHAHVAAVMAEHGITRPVVGVAFDGSGYGEDGHTWGSEILVADLQAYQRLAHLRYAPLPGGDLGARCPWRAALGYLSLDPGAERAFRLAFTGVEARDHSMAQRQTEHRLNAPLASSMGRLFDAAAAVIGGRRVAEYEGQAAMELEAQAGNQPADPLPFPLADDGAGWLLEPLPLLVALGEGAARGVSRARLAAAFHESVATTTADVVARACRRENIDTVVLCGGVFQNVRLLVTVRTLLRERGLTGLSAQRLPPNDGAISYGQAAVAAARMHLLEGD